MIIDIHTHTFPDRIAPAALDKLRHSAHIDTFLDGTCHALAASMKQAGIERSIILPVATEARQVEHINDSSARINETTEETGLVSLGCMHPAFEGYRDELSRMQRLGLKGFKIHPVYQGVDIDDIRFLRILDRAAELGLVVITHAGYDIGFPGVNHCSPSMSRHVIREIPSLKLVLAHMGGWLCWRSVLELLADTTVYLDTSFSSGNLTLLPEDMFWERNHVDQLSPEQMVHMIRSFGAHRILFGTDSPWADQKKALQAFRSLPLTQEEMTAVLGGNAERLLDL